MISIITPVYNVSPHIEAYLDSLLNQTYRDLEVVLVDDHSTDDSINKAKVFLSRSKSDLRIIFASTPKNSGPGEARNIGIELSKGEYIAFVDSDDTIHPDFCRLLYNKAIATSSDLCCCNVQFLDERGKVTGYGKNPIVEDGSFEREAKKRYLSSYVSYFCCYLYSRQLIESNNLRFTAGRSSEDSMFLACALICSKTIAQERKPLYNYWRRSHSLTMKKDITRYKDKMNSMDNLLTLCRQNGWYNEYKPELDFLYFKKGYLVSVFNYINNSTSPSSDVIRDLREHLSVMVPDYQRSSYLNNKKKFFVIDRFLSSVPRLASFLIRLYLKLNNTML